jgi:hypothetical protein
MTKSRQNKKIEKTFDVDKIKTETDAEADFANRFGHISAPGDIIGVLTPRERAVLEYVLKSSGGNSPGIILSDPDDIAAADILVRLQAINRGGNGRYGGDPSGHYASILGAHLWGTPGHE